MKLSWILFGLLIAMYLIVAVSLALPEIPGGHGKPHEKIEKMQQSADGSKRLTTVSFWLGGAFGVASVLFMVGTLALGLRKAEKIGAWKWPLTIGGVLYVAIFVAMLIAYRQSIEPGPAATLFSFPLPTAIMLFALWPWPLVFVVLYSTMFDRWVASPDDLKQFEKIVRRRRQKEDA